MSAIVPDVTGVLQAIEGGDPHAGEQLLPLVYDELRKLAARKLAREKPGQKLQPTALVHAEVPVHPLDGPLLDRQPAVPEQGQCIGVSGDSEPLHARRRWARGGPAVPGGAAGERCRPGDDD